MQWNVAVAADPANTAVEVRDSIRELAGDADTRQRAALRLLRPEAGPFLKAQQSQIIAALKNDWESEPSARVLGRLDLPADLRARLRDSDRVPDAVRARLGDAAAEGRVVTAFRGARRLGDRYKSASDLLYANTPAAWRAFQEGLASRELLQDVHGNSISEALILIRAYGETHPEEPLFSAQEYMKHANVTVEEFQHPEHQAYLRELENRLLALQQIHVTLNPPLLLNTDKIEKFPETAH